MFATKLLIVEDERVVAKDLELRLQSLGYIIVGSVASGEEAVRITAQMMPDLVIMDIRLQGEMDGIEAAERIRKEHFIPVVYLTAHSDEETIQRAQVTEPYGYLLKPFQDRELRTVIEMGLYKHRAERKIRDGERRYATTLSSIGDGVIATDRFGVINFINPVAEMLTGWKASDAIGTYLTEVFRIYNEYTHLPVANPVDRVLREGVIVGLANHTILTDRNGVERPIDDCAAPILDDHGTQDGAVLVFRDCSERRKHETERAILDERLRVTSKLESIGRMAGGIAHDFNNLLTVIISHTELLMMDKTSVSPDWTSLSAIQEVGLRAARLTKQLLTFSRQAMIDPKPLNLNEIVATTAKMLRPLIRENIAVSLQLDPNLEIILADQAQIEQVISNLATNANDAIGNSGEITFETKNCIIHDQNVADYPGSKTGKFVQLNVRDTGCGMAPDVLARVFEPFFSTKQVGAGTGLGLAVVHGVVIRAGGQISVSSELGKGTSFSILLPAACTDVPSTSIEIPSATAGTETILLVDDDNPVLVVTARSLKQQGYTVLAAKSAAEALTIAQEFKGHIHLMLTDMVMPEMGGRALSEAMIHLRPDIKFLFMSGYTDDTLFQTGSSSREEFIAKPFSPLEIAQKVRRVIDNIALD